MSRTIDLQGRTDETLEASINRCLHMREAMNLPSLAFFSGASAETIAQILEHMVSRGEVEVIKTFGETSDKERNTYYRLRHPKDGFYAWEQNLADVRAVWKAFRTGSAEIA